MGASPSVSVIIPTYNRAALVDRCIRSIQDSGVPNVEIIVVDDGGSDDTEAVIRGRARYVRQVNGGPAKARNAGVAASSGALLHFIDSDDEWINGGVGRLVEALDRHADVDLVFADSAMGNDESGFVSFVDTYGGASFGRLPGELRAGGMRVLARQPFFLQLSTRNVMFLASLVVRRHLFERIGGFDETLRGAADWDLFMRATAAGTVAFSAGPPTSRYYKHDEGMSTDSEHMQEEFIRALESVRRRSVLDAVERRHVEERLAAQARGWAWNAYDRGDLATARRRWRSAQALGVARPVDAVYVASTYLPASVVRLARKALWQVRRPAP